MNSQSSISQKEGMQSTTYMRRRYSMEELVLEVCHTPMTLVTFRKGRILVSDPDEFRRGIVCGQTMLLEGGEPASEKRLFELFADGVHDLEVSESWLVGSFLGMADALLRGRKTFPTKMPDYKDR